MPRAISRYDVEGIFADPPNRISLLKDNRPTVQRPVLEVLYDAEAKEDEKPSLLHSELVALLQNTFAHNQMLYVLM